MRFIGDQTPNATYQSISIIRKCWLDLLQPDVDTNTIDIPYVRIKDINNIDMKWYTVIQKVRIYTAVIPNSYGLLIPQENKTQVITEFAKQLLTHRLYLLIGYNLISKQAFLSAPTSYRWEIVTEKTAESIYTYTKNWETPVEFFYNPIIGIGGADSAIIQSL